MTHHIDPACYAGLPLRDLRSHIATDIDLLIAMLDAIDGDPDFELETDESNFANDRFGDERECDPAEWGIGDKDGLIEQNCTVYEVAI